MALAALRTTMQTIIATDFGGTFDRRNQLEPSEALLAAMAPMADNLHSAPHAQPINGGSPRIAAS